MTSKFRFKDFKGPTLFSSTFKALNTEDKNSRTFKDTWEHWIFVSLTQFSGVSRD